MDPVPPTAAHHLARTFGGAVERGENGQTMVLIPWLDDVIVVNYRPVDEGGGGVDFTALFPFHGDLDLRMVKVPPSGKSLVTSLGHLRVQTHDRAFDDEVIVESGTAALALRLLRQQDVREGLRALNFATLAISRVLGAPVAAPAPHALTLQLEHGEAHDDDHSRDEAAAVLMQQLLVRLAALRGATAPPALEAVDAEFSALRMHLDAALLRCGAQHSVVDGALVTTCMLMTERDSERIQIRTTCTDSDRGIFSVHASAPLAPSIPAFALTTPATLGARLMNLIDVRIDDAVFDRAFVIAADANARVFLKTQTAPLLALLTSSTNVFPLALKGHGEAAPESLVLTADGIRSVELATLAAHFCALSTTWMTTFSV